MTLSANANVLIAAQLYGGPAPAAAKARREAAATQDFTAELLTRDPKGQRTFNPTLSAPGAPKPLEPAKRFDAGAGRRDPLPSTPVKAPDTEQPRLARLGSRLDIRV